MARIMKPPVDGFNATDTGGDWYDGPPPPPGLYQGIVKKVMLAKRDDQQKLWVICEITEGDYKGAGVSKWMQFSETGNSWINQFLRALTDGSPEQFKGIREAFWHVGYEVGDIDQRQMLPIIKIGKKTNPIGMPINFTVRKRTDNQGVERTDIARFVVAKQHTEPEEDESDALEDYEPSGLDEFAAATTQNKVTVDLDEDSDPWS